jgi:predicted ATPase/DNA-binding SARP family transcriptional activator/Tfp pilus assembly protein PilF
MVRLSFLGQPQIERDGAPIAIDRHKAIALLAYVALSHQGQARDTLAALFWPDYDQGHAFAYLRRTLWTLNQALGPHVLDTGRETIALRRDANLWIDVDRFQSLLAACRTCGHAGAPCPPCHDRLDEAIALYRGDFLTGLTLRDSPDFETWQREQAEGLRADLAWALEQQALSHAALGAFDPALAAARRRVALDPLDESGHRLLMQLLVHAGQRTAALRQYQECVRLLNDELGVAPEAETVALVEQIRAGAVGSGARSQERSGEPRVRPGEPRVRPADQRIRPADQGDPHIHPAPLSVRPGLPVQATVFVGREAELGEIDQLLDDPSCRLLSLVGPGGIGKTRLAIEAASRRAGAFAHGAAFVPLAPLSCADDIVLAVAGALQLTFLRQDNAARQVLDFLCEKQVLLVMDNFEHLVAYTDLVSEILQCAPGVKLLVTSRQRLNLRDEWVLEVAGMPFPPDEQSRALDRYDAVRLFIQNARRAQVGFSSTDADMAAIVRICRMVAGMPLGIELAAAWVRLLACNEIAAEIARSLDFLNTSLRDVPAGHRSLRAVFEHSWNLLSDAERALFQRLSVFRGGFTRASAEAVAGDHKADGVPFTAPRPASSMVYLLSSLVDHSLLRRTLAGRYELHEVLCQYAAEKLATDPIRQEAAETRHCAYFAAFLDQQLARLKGREQPEALGAIRDEIENVRVAWSWAVTRCDITTIAQMQDSLLLFYEIQGWFAEGEEMFRRAVERLRGDGAQGVPASRLALRHAWFAFRSSTYGALIDVFRRELAYLRQEGAQLDYVVPLLLPSPPLMPLEEAEPLLRDCLAAWRAAGDQYGVVLCLNALGWCAYERHQFDETERCFLQSLELAHASGALHIAARANESLGGVAQFTGRLHDARRYYQEFLGLSRRLGYRWGTAYGLDLLGYVERQIGLYDEADAHHSESLMLSREMGDRLGIAGSLDNLSLVAIERGDYATARRLVDEALAIRRQLDDWPTIAVSVETLGRLELAEGNPHRAAELLGNSSAIRRDLGFDREALRSDALRSIALVRMGDLPGAREHLCRVIARWPHRQQTMNVMTALLGAAELLDVSGDRERAIPLLRCVQWNPATSHYKRVWAERLLRAWNVPVDASQPGVPMDDVMPALCETTLQAARADPAMVY